VIRRSISSWLTRPDEHLGDLHGVKRRALAELIAADEEVEDGDVEVLP